MHIYIGMVNLQLATRSNSRETFKKYTKHVDLQNKMVTLRGRCILRCY